jgi:hypothetical protein
MKSYYCSNERLEVRRSFYLGITVPSACDTTTYLSAVKIFMNLRYTVDNLLFPSFQVKSPSEPKIYDIYITFTQRHVRPTLL